MAFCVVHADGGANGKASKSFAPKTPQCELVVRGIVKAKARELAGLELLERTVSEIDASQYEAIAEEAMNKKIADVLKTRLPAKPRTVSSGQRKVRRLPPGPGVKVGRDGEIQDMRTPNLQTEGGQDYIELKKAIEGAVDQLPEVQRDLVRLCYFKGLTMSQAAQNLGMPLGTVKSAISRALGRLRENEDLRDYFSYLDRRLETP